MSVHIREINAHPGKSPWRWLMRRVCAVAGHRSEHIELRATPLPVTGGETLTHRCGQGECARCGTHLVIELVTAASGGT